MPSSDTPSTRKQVLVAALQWGLVQAFVLDTLGGLLGNYYRATTAAFFPPDWVTSIQFAAPLGLVVGALGGYRWITTGRGSTSPSAHRRRVVFVGSFVVCWALAIVPTMAFQLLLGERLFTVPFFVLPTLTAVAAFGVAHLLAYRVDREWYRRHRGRLLGSARGAIVGLILGMAGFAVYGSYLAATRTNFSLDGGPATVVATCLGAVAGYALTDSERGGDRAAEFLVVLLPSLLVLSLLMGLVSAAFTVLGVSDLVSSSATFVLPVVFSLGLASYLTYRAETRVYGRLVGQ
ncbi:MULTISPECIES: hypothetical protein [Haloferax]|uniref:Uncharacterized protein n=1 Tax=Haloferax massiliensis TaxID=1476858 RepID=A0A0D6JTN3_9EURY|nr:MULTISPECIES: hypothetical protein [Haloferax]MDS0242053.1 hypothetical protein [Haloferax sp. S2CR25]MDS0445174.1 hypothetical protein [Haloferax sp. S2CR25-2]CQR50978.1 hypothetical protein BN996_02464 [Haloferax massiliensis]